LVDRESTAQLCNGDLKYVMAKDDGNPHCHRQSAEMVTSPRLHRVRNLSSERAQSQTRRRFSDFADVRAGKSGREILVGKLALAGIKPDECPFRRAR
jgi:hypothetical protein